MKEAVLHGDAGNGCVIARTKKLLASERQMPALEIGQSRRAGTASNNGFNRPKRHTGLLAQRLQTNRMVSMIVDDAFYFRHRHSLPLTGEMVEPHIA